MNFKALILSFKSANAKFENKFNSLSKISEAVLIFGQLFILLILTAVFYSARISPDPHVFLTVLNSVPLLFENAASGLFLLWITAIFIDYIEKKNMQK